MLGAPVPVDAKSLGLPEDVWMLVARKLKGADRNHFMLAAKLFMRAGNWPDVVKQACRDLYKRLCVLEYEMPEFPSEDELRQQKEIDCINAYKRHFAFVQDKQNKELGVLSTRYKETVDKFLAKRSQQTANLTPLQFLEYTDCMIDMIVITIIKPLMKPGRLDISGKGLTRLPKLLFTAPQFKAYLDQLKMINLNNNVLHKLVVKNLPKLTTLYCNHNLIYNLKIESLPLLEDFQCAGNEIEGEMDLRPFPELCFVRVAHNDLTQLHLAGLRKLGSLICSDNKLEELYIDTPNIHLILSDVNRLKKITIVDPSQLVIPENYDEDNEDCLDIRYNRFESIPQNLVDQFGESWAQKILTQQGPAPDEEMDDQPEQQDVAMTELPAPVQPPLLMQYNRQDEEDLEEWDDLDETETLERKPQL